MPGFVACRLILRHKRVEKVIHTNESRAMSRMLRQMREGAGMRQEDLAVKLGEVRQTVSAIERGERMLLALELFAYLRPFGIKPSEFIARLGREFGDADEKGEPS